MLRPFLMPRMTGAAKRALGVSDRVAAHDGRRPHQQCTRRGHPLFDVGVRPVSHNDQLVGARWGRHQLYDHINVGGRLLIPWRTVHLVIATLQFRGNAHTEVFGRTANENAHLRRPVSPISR